MSRVGLGIRHERASLGLKFTSLAVPGEVARPLHTRVSEIDNGRERVDPSGLIQGIRATNSIAYRVSGYIKMAMLWNIHAELAAWAIKSLVVQLPEPEIYYPTGTELTLTVTAPWLAVVPKPLQNSVEQVTDTNLVELQDLSKVMPFRTIDDESGRPSDLVNLMFIGSRSQIFLAFHAAGWNLAQGDSIRTRIGVIRAAAELRGYSSPMSALLLDGEQADMSWQKGLNDVSKRHHIRVWRRPEKWHGYEIWMAAATRDIDYAYLRPGRTFSHRVSAKVDEEREKVAYDLAFTSCATPLAWIDRPQVPRSDRNGSGDFVVTDARLAVVRFGVCSGHASTNSEEPPTLIGRGGKWQRLLRREILITRNDLLRANLYWRLYEAGYLTLSYAWRRNPDVLAETPIPNSPRRRALTAVLSFFQ